MAREAKKKVEAEKERIFKLAASAIGYTLSALKHAAVFDDTLHARIAAREAEEYLSALEDALKDLEELLKREKEA